MVVDYVIKCLALNHGTAMKDTDSAMKGKFSYSITEHRPILWSHPGIALNNYYEIVFLLLLVNKTQLK